ncbi:BTAD domain-containing putative transcriptional regulator [Spongiactinospora sp. 9N601]|uniref:AfsR/SARP family transcriptional regulator n=1 Tax=Spongiactinospora sp. 9N601 TaxID=3375149 RepID=UPI0037BA7BD3
MTSMPLVTLRFRLLGPVTVHTVGNGRRDEGRADAGRVEAGERMHRLLLAILLAAAGRPVSTDRLITAMWDHTSPAGAAARIHAYTRDLRARLTTGHPSEQILPRNDGAGYRITIARDAVDAHRFRDDAAAAARALVGGDTQAGAALLRRALAHWGSGSGGTGEVPEPVTDLKGLWAEDYRRDLLAEHETAWLMCLQAELALGLHTRLIPELRAMARARPCDETVAAMLIGACYRAGRQDEAVAAYFHIRDRLGEEFGAAPGPCLSRLYDQILHHDPALDAPPPPPKGADMPQHPNHAAPDQAGHRTVDRAVHDNVRAFPGVTAASHAGNDCATGQDSRHGTGQGAAPDGEEGVGRQDDERCEGACEGPVLPGRGSAAWHTGQPPNVHIGAQWNFNGGTPQITHAERDIHIHHDKP